MYEFLRKKYVLLTVAAVMVGMGLGLLVTKNLVLLWFLGLFISIWWALMIGTELSKRTKAYSKVEYAEGIEKYSNKKSVEDYKVKEENENQEIDEIFNTEVEGLEWLDKE